MAHKNNPPTRSTERSKPDAYPSRTFVPHRTKAFVLCPFHARTPSGLRRRDFSGSLFLHSNPKDLPQTGQVAVNRGGIPPSKLARLARVANLIVSLPLYQFRE